MNLDQRTGPEQPRRVALIGASVRSAAESAKRGGFLVTGLDRFADQDTLAACERHLLLDHTSPMTDQPGKGPGMLDAHQRGETQQEIIELANRMPLIPVGGLHAAGNLLDRLPLWQPWPGQREAAAIVREVKVLSRVASGTSFRLPPWVPSESSAAANLDRLDGRRWLQKDLRSSGGLGVHWFENRPVDRPQSRPQAADDNRNDGSRNQAGPTQVLQQWVPGRALGATLLSDGSQATLLGVCRLRFTRKGQLPFVYCGACGPLAADASLWRELEAIGNRLVSISGLRGLFNLDFLAEPSGGRWLLEVNPRWSGSSELLERHLRVRLPGCSLLKLSIDGLNGIAVGNEVRAASRWQPGDPWYLKRIVFARRDLRFDHTPLVAALREGESLHDLPADGQLIRRGEPVCTLIRILPGTQAEGSGMGAIELIPANEQGPMHRHRALVKRIAGIGSLSEPYSPRSSA